MLRRIAQFIVISLALAGVCAAQSYPNASGWCEQGNGTINVNGNPNSPSFKVMKSFPQCTVTVYLPGTTTKATLFSNTTGTSLGNPFTATTTGAWQFYAQGGSYDVQFSGTGISAPFTTRRVRLGPTIYLTDFGVIADGTGTGGTDQSAQFQAAVNAATGGMLVVPAAPLAYAVSAGIQIPSNTTIVLSPGAVVQKLFGTQPSCSAPGCGSVFYMDSTAVHSNIWVKGGGAIDGNKANVTGISGDGGNFGILFENCTNCGTQDITVTDAYTGGVSVSCDTAVGIGNNVALLNTTITRSRRNNLEILCGTNTRMVGGVLSYATGGSLCAGADLEPFATGQLVDGFSMSGVEVHHNRDAGVLIQAKYDVNPSYSFTSLAAHDNGGIGLSATNFNVPGSGAADGTLSVIGGTYANNVSTAGLAFAGWKVVSTMGVNSYGSPRGLLLAAKVTNAILGPGRLSGTVHDLSVDGPNSIATLAGVSFACTVNCIQPGEEVNVRFPLTGTPITFTSNGVAYWPGDSPRTGAMAISPYITAIDAAGVNPEVLISDGTVAVGMQLITGVGGVFKAQTNHPAFLAANNNIFGAGAIRLDPNGMTSVSAGAFSRLAACTTSYPLYHAFANVTDSSTVTWGATVTGGGTGQVLAYCDGVNWTVFAK